MWSERLVARCPPVPGVVGARRRAYGRRLAGRAAGRAGSELDAQSGAFGSEGPCQLGPWRDGSCRLVQLFAHVSRESLAVGVEGVAFGAVRHVHAGVDDLALALADHVEVFGMG